MVKKKVWKGLLPIALILLVSAGIGVTGATVLHTMKLENPIRSSGVEGEVYETELSQNGKKVSIKNTGEADALVRAAYAQTWTSEDGIILPNVVNGKPIAVPKCEDHVVGYEETGWQDDPDSDWYYYQYVLPGMISHPGEVNETKPLMTHVDFDAEAFSQDKRYENAKYELHVTMEMVQAGDSESVSRDAAKALFRKSFVVDGAESADGDWNGNKYSCTITWNNDLGTPSDTETESNTIQEEP